MDDRPDGWGGGACVVCPARCGQGPGAFDVVDGPGPEYRLDRSIGWRVDVRTGAGVCVHPYRIGLAPGRYFSGDQAVPEVAAERLVPSAAALVLPDDETDLEGWLVAVLRVVPADGLLDAIAAAEQTAAERFAPGAVAQALRRVLGYELADRG